MGNARIGVRIHSFIQELSQRWEYFDLIGGTSTGGYVNIILSLHFIYSGRLEGVVKRSRKFMFAPLTLCFLPVFFALRLIAIMLGRLRTTTDEAIRQYSETVSAIFSKRNRKAAFKPDASGQRR